MKRETIETLTDVLGAIAAALLFVFLAWLYCMATPDQRSAEADLFSAQMEGGAK